MKSITNDTARTDRIEKKILLRAPRSRVWRALTDAEQFGQWFGCAIEGRFEPGVTARGKITRPPEYGYLTIEMVVERMDAERVFSYRWHPYAIERDVDYSKEPMTLVELTLEDAEGGTLLTVTESGFDRIPAARREMALRMNGEGWRMQLENVARYVGTAA